MTEKPDGIPHSQRGPLICGSTLQLELTPVSSRAGRSRLLVAEKVRPRSEEGKGMLCKGSLSRSTDVSRV